MNISAGQSLRSSDIAGTRSDGHVGFDGALSCGQHPSREDRFPMMQSIRKEVREFMHAAETLLGPIVGSRDLNQDERDMIGLYVQQIMEKFPPA